MHHYFMYFIESVNYNSLQILFVDEYLWIWIYVYEVIWLTMYVKSDGHLPITKWDEITYHAWDKS